MSHNDARSSADGAQVPVEAGSPASASPAVDRVIFRNVIGHFATGVTVITAVDRGQRFGMTASAVSSLSLDPPMLLACINKVAPTELAVRRSGAFAVNILTADQGQLAERFGLPREDKFAGLPLADGVLGVPLLREALARIECVVDEVVTGGTHSVFFGRVINAEASSGTPLAYYRGKLGRFEFAEDQRVYSELRAMVMNRDLPLGESLDIDAVAARLSGEVSATYHAVARLAGEGFLTRDTEHGYVVTPLDVAISDQAMDAKCALELGVVEQTIGKLAAGQLEGLRDRMQATMPLISNGRFTDLDAYIRLNAEFHEYMVGLAGNAALSSAYRQLGLAGVMARTLTRDTFAGDDLVVDHRLLVEAYEAGDVDLARDVVRSHCAHAKSTQAAAIARVGGRI